MKDLLSRQLPAPMASDPTLVRFLKIFEDIAGPLYRRAGEHHLLVSPGTAPPRLLAWMSAIMDAEVDGLGDGQKRDLTQTIIDTRAERGSTQAIERILGAYTGAPVKVSEGGGVAYDADEQDREGPNRAPVRRPPPPDGVETTASNQDPALVGIDVSTLGAFTEQRFANLVRKMIPAHMIARITVQGRDINGGRGLDAEREPGEAS